MSNTEWQIYTAGDRLTGMQSTIVLNTIAGSAKSEIVVNDVTHLNTIAHFSDIEIWAPTTDPLNGFIFNGTSDYVTLTNTVSMDSDDWAISWWMKRDNHTAHNIFAEGKGFGANSGNIGVDCFADNVIRIESYTNGTWIETLSTAPVFTHDGEWHHYVLDFNSTNTKLYVDGSLTDTGTKNTDVHTFDINYFSANQFSAGEGNYLKGSIADVRIYASSVDQAEVTNLYNGIYSTPCHNFWHMDQRNNAIIGGMYDRYEDSPGTASSTLTVDSGAPDQFLAFKGRIDLLLPDYDSNTLLITARDYTSELLSRAIVEAYGGPPVLRSVIVKDILLKYGKSMTWRNVIDSPAGTATEYLFKESAWQAIVKCSGGDHYKFHVDTDNDFHYEPKGYYSSDITLEVGIDNILNYNIIENDAEIVNAVNVWGEESGGIQVVVFIEDLDSQSYYNVINEKRLVDRELTTEAAAIEYAYAYLEDHAYVLEIIEIDLLGYETLRPGELITLKISDLNINDSYLIVDKTVKYPDGITQIKVAKYAKNLESMISDMIDKIMSLERYFMESGQTVLKLHRVNESQLLSDRILIEKSAADDSFRIGVAEWDVIGVTKIGGRGSGFTVVYDSGY